MTASDRLRPRQGSAQGLVEQFLRSGGRVTRVPEARRKALCAGFSNTMSFKGRRRVPVTGR